MIVFAVVGLSGVGKSFLLRKTMEETPFLHVTASELIKGEIARQQAAEVSSEDLRLGRVLDNQELLLKAFRREVRGADGLVVFDAHTVIDGASGLVELPPSVFRSVSCAHIAVLTEEPGEIVLRRKNDSGRIRPFRTEEELAEHQERSVLAATKIASVLQIPISIHHQPTVGMLAEVLRQYAVPATPPPSAAPQ